MEDSILLTIRKLIGGEEEYSSEDPFVLNLIIAINTALGVVNQLGVGVPGFEIEDETATWSDFLADTESKYGVKLNEVKSLVYMKVRKEFDPPTGSTLMNALDGSIEELTWRICTKVETAGEVS